MLPPVRGGLFLWARATDGTDTTSLLSRAVPEGVAFVPGPAFAVGRDATHADRLRLSFASVAPDDAAEAASRLAAAWNPPPTPGTIDDEPVTAGAALGR